MSKSPRSAAQTAASRLNGARSLGPITDPGKCKISKNRMTHGFRSGAITLNNEDRQAYDAHLDAYLRRYQPADKVEEDLVGLLASSMWLIMRNNSVELALLELEIAGIDDDIHGKYEAMDQYGRLALASKSQPATTPLNSSAATNPRLSAPITAPSKPLRACANTAPQSRPRTPPKIYLPFKPKPNPGSLRVSRRTILTKPKLLNSSWFHPRRATASRRPRSKTLRNPAPMPRKPPHRASPPGCRAQPFLAIEERRQTLRKR